MSRAKANWEVVPILPPSAARPASPKLHSVLACCGGREELHHAHPHSCSFVDHKWGKQDGGGERVPSMDSSGLSGHDHIDLSSLLDTSSLISTQLATSKHHHTQQKYNNGLQHLQESDFVKFRMQSCGNFHSFFVDLKFVDSNRCVINWSINFLM